MAQPAHGSRIYRTDLPALRSQGPLGLRAKIGDSFDGFVQEAHVLLADGTRKLIKDIGPDDLVWSA